MISCVVGDKKCCENQKYKAYFLVGKWGKWKYCDSLQAFLLIYTYEVYFSINRKGANHTVRKQALGVKKYSCFHFCAANESCYCMCAGETGLNRSLKKFFLDQRREADISTLYWCSSVDKASVKLSAVFFRLLGLESCRRDNSMEIRYLHSSSEFAWCYIFIFIFLMT